MSAWIVSKGHIDALVQSMVVESLVEMTKAQEVGRMLWEECRISVSSRYPGDADGEWPGPIGLTVADIVNYKPEMIEAPLDDAKVKRQLDCYDYQTCEHDGYRTSEACRLVQTLTELLVLRNDMDPNFDQVTDVPWGVDSVQQCVA